MEIIKLRNEGLFIKVNEKEALTLIQSLANQMLANNPNVGRSEVFTSNGGYLSIAVSEMV